MVCSGRWSGNCGISYRYFSKSLAEAAQNCTIEGCSRKTYAQKYLNGICRQWNKKVTYRPKGVEFECCLKWYHVKCDDKSDDECGNIREAV